MAEQTIIDPRRSVVLADTIDPVAVAAAMNPAMSSWVALRQRVSFQAGHDVLILGATGNAGQLAVQIARLFGAGQIIAAGRGAERLAGLPGLGATATVLLGADDADDRLGPTAADVDFVLDYLWGEPTTAAMTALVTRRGRPGEATHLDRDRLALRAARLQIVGSGQGSVSHREYVAELPALAQEIASGTLDADARAMPLARVEAAWAAAGAKQRIVLTPQS
jgi:NADPH:quinone reductase-like Zn-dependent oxidoreductase